MVENARKSEVGQRLEHARRRTFKTAAEAARALGMKPHTLRAHETGQNGVDLPALERYARRYGVRLTWLLTGSDYVDPAPAVRPGFPVKIVGWIQDGLWLPDNEEEDYPVAEYLSEGDEREYAICDDYRFPPEIIAAYRVVNKGRQGFFVNEVTVFCVPYWHIGYKIGDHVLVIRDQGNRFQWTLRRVDKFGEHDTRFVAITSDEPPLAYSSGHDGEGVFVMGVVFETITRHAVNALDINRRIEIENDAGLQTAHAQSWRKRRAASARA
jgi:hypothetical protein